MNNIVITGGGTGGHTFAAIAIVERLKEKFNDISIIYIGSKNGLEKNTCEKIEYIDYKEISTGKFRRDFDFRNFFDFFRFLKGILGAWKILGEKNFNFVLSTGGFVSLPVVIAAYLKKTPVIVHEQTSIPGLANKIAFKLSKKILLSYKIDGISNMNSKTVLFGNPVRRLVSYGFNNWINKNTKQKSDKPILFVTAGANGSLIFNNFVFENIKWLKNNFFVILQSGKHITNVEFIEKMKIEKKEFPNIIYDFIEAEVLGEIYAQEPILLARSGAGTITDIINFKLASILIPLKNSAGNEQLFNANILFKHGASLIIEEHDFKSDKVRQALLNAAINCKKIKNALEKFPSFKDSNIEMVFSEFFI
ncbi:MAG: UDP-N-acetylglucosamine--N-acetylmuramyl-(pentapeptide) pyrophosphoryl-undecaprenol N-acetylglucosamine transferase [Candidatus Muirbacterium halophilum]|nr:UDP-N-acetylglucosamine--N-acetylmuramyl-(pentapeptide) pyrophosphoryl-undecaprenol N-acetylglucosamine transferase [Candidatus Muirbacterium halophilum]MCK9476050.1 UDP-N-acetylglucosamine--N-acetylmuramyl-(pentapeptide) pyrophosphoryl-undecaprenol N-acetylglucosamine transferase [Candidatus Muirbacterium halophilum]